MSMRGWIGGGIAAFMAGLLAGCGSAPPPRTPPPTPVVVVAAATRDVTVTSQWVATLDGYVNANIQPQVGGYVIRQNYHEGEAVKKDQVLFEIDPRPFQAALDQARGQLAAAGGQLATAQAQIGVVEAQLGANALNVKRDTPEAAAHAIPQSQLDNDTQAELASKAALAAAQAQVQAQQAAVEAAQAAVELATLNLGYTQVRSLIDGVAGIAQVQIGNLVTPQTVLTAVSQLEPIKAYFPISSEEYMASVTHTDGALDLLGPRAEPLQLVLADGSLYPHPGHVLFADRQVDASTGTLRLAAAFPNPGGQLRPGQPVQVRAATQVLHQAVVVPQSAVSQLQGNYQVAVIGTKNVVALRTVAVGPTSGTDWVITSGLKPGEQVVADGTAKVHDGSQVRPLPAAAKDPR